VREWVERRSTTQPTLTRRCTPASPWQGEASLCSFVGNSRQFSVPSLHPSKPLSDEHRSTPGVPVATAVREPPRQHAETRVVHRNPHATGRQCRGDPVGRPAGGRPAGRPPRRGRTIFCPHLRGPHRPCAALGFVWRNVPAAAMPVQRPQALRPQPRCLKVRPPAKPHRQQQLRTFGAQVGAPSSFPQTRHLRQLRPVAAHRRGTPARPPCCCSVRFGAP
jgi:hypothetical protein